MYPRSDEDLRSEAHVPLQHISKNKEKFAESMVENGVSDHDEFAQLISYWYTPPRPDDDKSAFRIIEELIEDPQNQHREPYRVGIAFGRAFAAIDECDFVCVEG